MTQNGVVIDERFPFNILSEIALLDERPDVITKVMGKGTWTFSDKNGTFFQAAQLIPNNKLFFIRDILRECPLSSSASHCDTGIDITANR